MTVTMKLFHFLKVLAKLFWRNFVFTASHHYEAELRTLLTDNFQIIGAPECRNFMYDGYMSFHT